MGLKNYLEYLHKNPEPQTVEPKFAVGDEIFLMGEDCAIRGRVAWIENLRYDIAVLNGDDRIIFTETGRSESTLFESLDKLKESLIQEIKDMKLEEFSDFKS